MMDENCSLNFRASSSEIPSRTRYATYLTVLVSMVWVILFQLRWSRRKQSRPTIKGKQKRRGLIVTGGFDTGEKSARPTQPPRAIKINPAHYRVRGADRQM